MLLTHNADCIETMKAMPENCVDSIVTDPPYELGFMGKSWDASGIAFNVEVWQEALRVLKPGGFLLAFSGSRTYHRMAVAIEDAGFEIRDQIMWVYGSGFPKSHDVSKAIDKAAGAEREVIGETRKGAQSESTGRYGAWGDGITPTAPPTDEAKQWQGWGTALKPAHEPIVVARKPLIGTVAENVLTFGTGGLNIDASRIGTEGGTRKEPSNDKSTTFSVGAYLNQKAGTPIDAGRWPANFIHDGSDEVLELFPNSGSGNFQKSSRTRKGFMLSGSENNIQEANAPDNYGDFGSAARFFYCAKASKRDRNEGLAQSNHHPTVKPTDLMRYLCRLVTQPGGLILDPFMGSGSTGKAAALEGFSFIGIEQSAEYVEIANARIKFAKDGGE